MEEDFDHAIVETITNLSLVGVSSYFDPIVDEVEKIKGQYGKTLRATYIGREDTTVNFGKGSTQDWKELSKRWRQRKNSNGELLNKFYRGISPTDQSLASALFYMPGEKLFGKTTLRTRIDQVQTAGFYNPRIRRNIDTVYRDDRGRFARADADARKTVLVTVNPFPHLQGQDDIITQLPISDLNKTKLYASAEDRPLIEPYTEWFFTRKIRAKIVALAEKVRS